MTLPLTLKKYLSVKYFFKVKSTKTILICWLWSKSTIKTKEQWHAVFIFKREHMHMILIFFTVNFEHVFVSWALNKIQKKP